MVKKSMDDLLKRRMSAAQQASELEVGNEAYETMFQAKADVAAPRFCELPIKSLCPFRTADIGFRPYPPEKLRAFSQQLAEQCPLRHEQVWLKAPPTERARQA